QHPKYRSLHDALPIWVNDVVGRWLVAYPAFVPLEAYRRSHFAHHKDELGPNEPDMNLYVGYPITRSSFRRKLWRDARGSSGWKKDRKSTRLNSSHVKI